MPEANEFMRRAVSDPDAAFKPPEIATDVPWPARNYGLHLGSKDSYEVDRQAIGGLLERFRKASTWPGRTGSSCTPPRRGDPLAVAPDHPSDVVERERDKSTAAL